MPLLQAADHIPQAALLQGIAARIPDERLVDLVQPVKRAPVLRLVFRLPRAVQFGITAPRHQDIRARDAIGHVADIALRIIVQQRKDMVIRHLGREIMPRLSERPLCAVAKADPVHTRYLPA